MQMVATLSPCVLSREWLMQGRAGGAAEDRTHHGVSRRATERERETERHRERQRETEINIVKKSTQGQEGSVSRMCSRGETE
jgi:hypothetical protein